MVDVVRAGRDGACGPVWAASCAGREMERTVYSVPATLGDTRLMRMRYLTTWQEPERKIEQHDGGQAKDDAKEGEE